MRGTELKTAAANREVLRRGEEILQSEIFRKAMRERHHKSSVGVHSIGVAEASLRISDALGRLGVRSDRDVLVCCALCHDFGIIDRVEKYKTRAHCCRRHPANSLLAYELYVHSASPAERDCILHHMFPVLPVPPHTWEGLIINLADKWCSIREMLSR